MKFSVRWIIGVILYLLIVIGFVSWVTAETGRFIYPLDDTYIHIEIAKQLSVNQTWGINPGEFGSASSSPLYTLLLSLLFTLFGVNEFIPLYVNIIASLLLIIIVGRYLTREKTSLYQIQIGRLEKIKRPLLDWLSILSLLLLVPLPIITLSGMEHVLQCLFAFIFLIRFEDFRRGERSVFPVCLSAALLCFTRYEGLFLVGAVVLIALIASEWKAGIAILFSALLPLLVFGWYSMEQGSYPLPNSVLVKSGVDNKGIGAYLKYLFVDKLIIGETRIPNIATRALLLILFIAGLLQRSRYRTGIAVITIGVIMHLMLASTGWFYRYEAYLVLCGSIILLLHLFASHLRLRAWALVLLLVLSVPIGLRSFAAFTKARQASINIYEQQIQMGRFLGQHYKNEVIAANDIGAVSYYTDGHLLDLWGLASIDVTRARRNGNWNSQYLDSLARAKGVKVAVIYESWFDSSLYNKWYKVADWKVENNVILGDDRVSWYALTPSDSLQLANRLKLFRSRNAP